MKLVLRAPDETTLRLDLEDLTTPLSRQITVSVFFMQCVSFLEYQRRMVENQERSNA